MIFLMNLERYYRRQRWKAAALIGTLVANLWILLALIFAIWTVVTAFGEGIEITAQNLYTMILAAATLFYPMVGCGTLPIFVISTLGCYFQSSLQGHFYLDKYWKNPYVKGDERRYE